MVARADNGEIRLGFSGVPDLVDTVSDNGSIVIDLPQGGQKYTVNASADNGEVSIGVPRSDSSAHVVKARSDNGEVKVRSAN
ncbi:Lipoprotein OS=Streptomyces microflavus OX=1919 GN=Smic_21380 PE=4 SV=1 [Streptomyces microflavus]